MDKQEILRTAAITFLELEAAAREDGPVRLPKSEEGHLIYANIAALELEDLARDSPNSIDSLLKEGVIHYQTRETLPRARRVFAEYMRNVNRTLCWQDCYAISTTCYSAMEAYAEGRIRLLHLNPAQKDA